MIQIRRRAGLPNFLGAQEEIRGMLFWIGTALIVATLFISFVFPQKTFLIRLVIFVLGLLGVLVSGERYYQDQARIDELSELRWVPLTANEIAVIKQSVAGIRPAQPTMNIQYLDSNAHDLALSFKQLFSDIGFDPKIVLDTRLSAVGTIKIEEDDSDVEMLSKIINSIENVTQGRIKCEFANSRGQGQTRIFIGQKGTNPL
jgi:hypothetical protein